MRTMNSFLMLTGSLAVCAACIGGPSRPQAIHTKPTGSAGVTIRIVDSYGVSVDYKIESFHTVDEPLVELASRFHGLTLDEAAKDTVYEFTAVPSSRDRFPVVRRKIYVTEDYTFAVFSVQKNVFLPDMITPTPFPATRFVMRPQPAQGGLLWVIVRPAFEPQVSGLGIETAAVDNAGGFSLHGTHGGRYLVTLCSESKILKTAVVDIPLLAPEKPIEIQF